MIETRRIPEIGSARRARLVSQRESGLRRAVCYGDDPTRTLDPATWTAGAHGSFGSFGFCSNGSERVSDRIGRSTHGPEDQPAEDMRSPDTTAVLYARVRQKIRNVKGFRSRRSRSCCGYAREQQPDHPPRVRRRRDRQAGRARRLCRDDRVSEGDAACRIILVEKTDRLYRNFRDYVTLEDLSVAIHFVKENTVLSPDSRSADKLMHNIRVAMAKNYIDNLSEEVKKGLREKAEQGHFPAVAHVGYVNNRATRRIESDPVRGPLVARVFELYASGEYSVKALTAKANEIGLTHHRGDRRMMKSEMHRMLAEPDLYRRVPLARGASSRIARTARSAKRPLPGPGGATAEARVRYAEAAARVHGSADVCPVRLLDHGRDEEGQVHLLPLHRIQRRVRQYLHPRGATRRAPRRDDRAYADLR